VVAVSSLRSETPARAGRRIGERPVGRRPRTVGWFTLGLRAEGERPGEVWICSGCGYCPASPLPDKCPQCGAKKERFQTFV